MLDTWMHESMVSGTYPNASVNVHSKNNNLRLTKCVSISLEGICSACTPNITPWARTGHSRLFCRQIGGGLFSRLLGSGLFSRLTGTRLLSTVWTVAVDVIALAGVFIYQNKFTQSCYHTQYLQFVLLELSCKFMQIPGLYGVQLHNLPPDSPSVGPGSSFGSVIVRVLFTVPLAQLPPLTGKKYSLLQSRWDGQLNPWACKVLSHLFRTSWQVSRQGMIGLNSSRECSEVDCQCETSQNGK